MQARASLARYSLLVLLLVLVKAGLVLCLGDVFFYGEELQKGTAAKAMIDGLPVPHHQLAYHYYEGGGFVASHLAALAFLAVGQTLLAHKLVALGFQIAILLCGCHLAQRLYGERAALWFGLLFILAPESYQKLSLINLGIHFEATLFLLWMLALGAKLSFSETSRRRDWLLLGVVTGFGLYFSYQVVVAAAWVAGFLAYKKPRRVFGLEGLLGVAGTVIGGLPLITMYFLVGNHVFDIHGADIAGDADGPSSLELFGSFMRSIFIDKSLGGTANAMLWIAVVLASLPMLLSSKTTESEGTRPTRRQATGYLLGYMAVFLAIYFSTGFVQGVAYHYFLVLRLVPLWICAALLVAGMLGNRSSGQRGLRSTAASIAGFGLLILGLRASYQVMAAGRPGELTANWHLLRHHKGYEYGEYFQKVMWHFDGSREDKLRLAEQFDEEALVLLRANAVKSLFAGALIKETGGNLGAAWVEARRSLVEVSQGDDERLKQYELGLGALLVEGNGWNRQATFEKVASMQPRERAPVLEALGRFGGKGFAIPDSIAREVKRSTGCDDPASFLRGIGSWAYPIYCLKPAHFKEITSAYPADARRALLEGFAEEQRLNLIP